MLKILVFVLFFLLLISLGSGLYFLVQDQGSSRRTFHSLGVRLVLATTMMAVLIYGLATGQLQSKAPWEARQSAASNAAGPVSPDRTSEDVDKQE